MYGFKSDRVDELLPLYDIEFDHDKRVKIIQEIDSIIVESRYSALGLSREPPIRLLFWNKFGYLTICCQIWWQNGGYFVSWWFDDKKAEKLKSAMSSNGQLDVNEMDHTYWKDLQNF